MARRRLAGLALLLPLALAPSVRPAVAGEKERADRIDALVHAAGISDDAPGVAVCVCVVPASTEPVRL